jgi:hypothetical protein
MNEVPKHTAVQKHGVFSLLTVQTWCACIDQVLR